MHLEANACIPVRVEELERAPVQREERPHAGVEPRGRRAPPEAPEPAHEGGVERRAENERVTAGHELAHPLADHPRRRERIRHARHDPARVSERYASAYRAPLEHGHRRARARELPCAGEPDHASADDGDRRQRTVACSRSSEARIAAAARSPLSIAVSV